MSTEGPAPRKAASSSKAEGKRRENKLFEPTSAAAKVSEFLIEPEHPTPMTHPVQLPRPGTFRLIARPQNFMNPHEPSTSSVTLIAPRGPAVSPAASMAGFPPPQALPAPPALSAPPASRASEVPPAPQAPPTPQEPSVPLTHTNFAPPAPLGPAPVSLPGPEEPTALPGSDAVGALPRRALVRPSGQPDQENKDFQDFQAFRRVMSLISMQPAVNTKAHEWQMRYEESEKQRTLLEQKLRAHYVQYFSLLSCLQVASYDLHEDFKQLESKGVDASDLLNRVGRLSSIVSLAFRHTSLDSAYQAFIDVNNVTTKRLHDLEARGLVIRNIGPGLKRREPEDIEDRGEGPSKKHRSG